MGEAYSWTEGQIHFWTGAVTSSANATALGYATDSFLNFRKGWVWNPNLQGGYLPHLEAREVTLTLGSYLTNNHHLQNIFNADTLAHFRLRHSGYPNGDHGFLLYSGSINLLNYVGSEGQVYRFRAEVEAHDWSAF